VSRTRTTCNASPTKVPRVCVRSWAFNRVSYDGQEPFYEDGRASDRERDAFPEALPPRDLRGDGWLAYRSERRVANAGAALDRRLPDYSPVSWHLGRLGGLTDCDDPREPATRAE